MRWYFFQLSDAVSVIGREDFPDKWTNLLPVSTLKYKVVYIEEGLNIHQMAR